MSSVEILWPAPETLIPQPRFTYLDVHDILKSSIRLTGVGSGKDIRPRNLLFNSPPGLGKSLLCATLAHELGKIHGKPVPMVTYDCSEDTRDYHLRGSFTIRPDGSTAFVPGPFPAAIHLANQTGLAVLTLEEISALTPGAQKQINAMTDWRDGIYIPQLAQLIRLDPQAKLVVLASMNPSAFGGAYTLNADLRSRFTERKIPVPDQAKETKILKKICPFATGDNINKATSLAMNTRTDATDYKLSTRDLVQLLENIELLGELEGALTCIADKFEQSDRATVADRIWGSFQVKVAA